jgi:hypothetical protein
MAERGAPARGRSMTFLWMILALLTLGGFLTWLAVASEPTAVAVVEEEDADDVELDADGVAVVERDTLAGNAGRYAGQTIRVRGVEATGRLGDNIFWGELGNMERQAPILIRMAAELAGQEIQSGMAYTITGEVQRVTEELVATWAEQGEFAGEGEELQAMFADYYIQASDVRPTRASRPEQQPSR